MKLALSAALGAAILASAGSSLAADGKPGPCASAAVHQFDFWIGR